MALALVGPSLLLFCYGLYCAITSDKISAWSVPVFLLFLVLAIVLPGRITQWRQQRSHRSRRAKIHSAFQELLRFLEDMARDPPWTRPEAPGFGDDERLRAVREYYEKKFAQKSGAASIFDDGLRNADCLPEELARRYEDFDALWTKIENILTGWGEDWLEKDDVLDSKRQLTATLRRLKSFKSRGAERPRNEFE